MCGAVTSAAQGNAGFKLHGFPLSRLVVCREGHEILSLQTNFGQNVLRDALQVLSLAIHEKLV